jgi:hypothetical protein
MGMMSYNGKIAVQTIVRKPMLPNDQDAAVLQQYFKEELMVLYTSCRHLTSLDKLDDDGFTLRIESYVHVPIIISELTRL